MHEILQKVSYTFSLFYPNPNPNPIGLTFVFKPSQDTKGNRHCGHAGVPNKKKIIKILLLRAHQHGHHDVRFIKTGNTPQSARPAQYKNYFQNANSRNRFNTIEIPRGLEAEDNHAKIKV